MQKGIIKILNAELLQNKETIKINKICTEHTETIKVQ